MTACDRLWFVLRRVLFVCTANACQSQMAEGWLRALGAQHFVARSAGVEPRHLHPLATAVMQETGVDISRQRGKGLDAVRSESFDLVVTLAELEVELPPFRGAPLHRTIPVADPTWIETEDGHDIDEFRRARDELRVLVEGLVREPA